MGENCPAHTVYGGCRMFPTGHATMLWVSTVHLIETRIAIRFTCNQKTCHFPLTPACVVADLGSCSQSARAALECTQASGI